MVRPGVDDKDVAVAEVMENLMHGGESTSFSGQVTSSHCNNGEVFVRDFEPRPSDSTYPDDAEITSYPTTFNKDFEARPDKTQKELVNDFEPRPNLSVYQD